MQQAAVCPPWIGGSLSLFFGGGRVSCCRFSFGCDQVLTLDTCLHGVPGVPQVIACGRCSSSRIRLLTAEKPQKHCCRSWSGWRSVGGMLLLSPGHRTREMLRC